MDKRYQTIFCRFIVLLCILLVGYKLLCDSTYLYACHLADTTEHLTYFLLACAFVLGTALTLFSGWCRKLSAGRARLAAALLFAGMMLVQLILILTAFRQYLPWADTLSVLNEAISMTSRDVPQITSAGRYFEIYGNNYFFTIFLYGYFRFFRLLGLTAYWTEALFLNMAAIDLGVFFAYATARRLAGPSRALGVLALCAVNPVVYVFLPFVYTNTVSIPFLMGIFYLCIRLLQANPGRSRRSSHSQSHRRTGRWNGHIRTVLNLEWKDSDIYQYPKYTYDISDICQCSLLISCPPIFHNHRIHPMIKDLLHVQ